ncbi:MAG: hypothetical protein M1401_14225 [Chloroflexi bacterium]|nr:hypothetical protein [Chloroflexota bacterium]
MKRRSLRRVVPLALLLILLSALTVGWSVSGLPLAHKGSTLDASLAMAFSTDVCPECPSEPNGVVQSSLDSPALPPVTGRPHPRHDAVAFEDLSLPPDAAAARAVLQATDAQTCYVVLHALANLSPDEQNVLMSGMERALGEGGGLGGLRAGPPPTN